MISTRGNFWSSCARASFEVAEKKIVLPFIKAHEIQKDENDPRKLVESSPSGFAEL